MLIISLLPILFAPCFLSSFIDKGSSETSVESGSVAYFDLHAVCSAENVDYDAIRVAMLANNFSLADARACIEIFCRRNDVDGLVSVYSNPEPFDNTLSRIVYFRNAGRYGHMPVIKYFVKWRNPGSNDMKVMAKAAAAYNNLEAIKYVMSRAKYPHASESASSDVLAEAAKVGNTDIVRWVLSEYMTASQDELHSVAETADAYQRWDVIEVLIEHGFNINDDTWLDMADIRNNYTTWQAQRGPLLETLLEHLPKDISEKVIKTFPDVDAGPTI